MQNRSPNTDQATFLAEVQAGLSSRPMTLPCKYFYDETGSRLFDRICSLPEYYPTRLEEAILREHGPVIADALGDNISLIEYGSGSGRKTRLLLRQVSAVDYVPIDISGEFLEASARLIQAEFPNLAVRPVVADYSRPMSLPIDPSLRRVIYFSGSTIGNFHRARAAEFLRGMAAVAGADGHLLIGVDLRKDPNILWDAYNDSAGLTARFNLNLLRRINQELGADFNLDQFRHQAPFNADDGRVEMHLVSRIDQEAHLDGASFHFDAGQSIRTECSYKYTLEDFANLAASVGLTVRHVWTDPKNWFSLQLLQ